MFLLYTIYIILYIFYILYIYYILYIIYYILYIIYYYIIIYYILYILYIIYYILLYYNIYIYIGSGDVWWTRTCQTSGRLQPLKGSERDQNQWEPVSWTHTPKPGLQNMRRKKILHCSAFFPHLWAVKILIMPSLLRQIFDPISQRAWCSTYFAVGYAEHSVVVDELHNVTPWFHPNEFVWSTPKSFNLESFIILFPVFRSPFEAQFLAKAQNLVGDPNLLPVKSCQIHEGRTSLV